MERFKALGGGTLVDVTGLTNGRDVNFLARLSELTGVHIVAATGFENQANSIPGHFLGRAYRATTDSAIHWLREIPGSFYPSHGESMEYMMFLFFNELTEGMAAPGMVRTHMKAGMVRAGSSWDGLSRLEEFSVRGAALAATKSGAFVVLEGISQIERQLELVAEYGLSPSRIVVSHCDDRRASDPARDRGLAERGFYVAFDHIGWQDSNAAHAMADADRAQLVKQMVDSGHAERVLLSCSAIGHPLGCAGSGHDFGYLLDSFVPVLKTTGVGDDAIQTMLVGNPKRLLVRS